MLSILRTRPLRLSIISPQQPKEVGLPFTAYFSVDEVREVSGCWIFGYGTDLAPTRFTKTYLLTFLGWNREGTEGLCFNCDRSRADRGGGDR